MSSNHQSVFTQSIVHLFYLLILQLTIRDPSLVQWLIHGDECGKEEERK